VYDISLALKRESLSGFLARKQSTFSVILLIVMKFAPEDTPFRQRVVKALSYHGAFLKKHVISVLNATPGVFIHSEEHPADFAGKTRAADIIAVADAQKMVFVIECKKVDPAKSWIFFKATDQRYRVARKFNHLGPSSSFRTPSPEYAPICSEGYEYREIIEKNPEQRVKRADQSPVFEAAGQVAGAFLGFVHNRISELQGPAPDKDFRESYIPVLITNARLFLIDADDIKLDPKTADVISEPALLEVARLILKQPAAAPRDFTDFRTSVVTDEGNQRFHESIYVVNIKDVAAFFSPGHCESLAHLSAMYVSS
jgi:hypothetical protein